MVTANQATAFYEDNAQMGIPHATVVQMRNEGILLISDLEEFSKEDIDNLANTLRKTPIPNVTPPLNYTFGVKSQKRRIVAAEIVRYYVTVGRKITASDMLWNPVLKDFEVQWNSIKQRKEQDSPETPR